MFTVDARVNGRGGAISGVYSKHDNNKEDCRFKFRYSIPTGGTKLFVSDLGWTKYDSYLIKKYNNNEFITGVESYHNNQREDRVFNFFLWWISRCDKKRL